MRLILMYVASLCVHSYLHSTLHSLEADDLSIDLPPNRSIVEFEEWIEDVSGEFGLDLRGIGEEPI